MSGTATLFSRKPAPPAILAAALTDVPVYLTVPGGNTVGFGLANITPELAKQITGINYRKRRDHRVVYYSRQMSAGLWRVTPQGLIFFADGSRADGDHRLSAVVECGKLQMFVVTWGWPENISEVLDSGLPRSSQDYLRVTLGDKWTHPMVAAVRILAGGGCASITSGREYTYPNGTLADMCVVLEEPLGFAQNCMARAGVKKGFCRGEILAMLAAQSYCLDRAKIERFCHGVCTGLGMNNDHEQNALVARNHLLEHIGEHSSDTRNEICAKTYSALVAFCEGRRLQKLYGAMRKNRFGQDSYDVSKAIALPKTVQEQINEIVAPLKAMESQEVVAAA